MLKVDDRLGQGTVCCMWHLSVCVWQFVALLAEVLHSHTVEDAAAIAPVHACMHACTCA